MAKRDARLEELLRKVADEPGEVRWVLALGDLHLKQGDVRAAVAAYEEAARLFEKGPFTLKAVAVWGTIVKLAPDYAEGHMRQALGLHALELFDDALAALRRAAELYGARGDAVEETRARQLIESWTRPR